MMASIFFFVFHSQKHNKTNYVELADFDDKRLTVMPVPVPPVNYSDVKIDSRYMELCYYYHTVLSQYFMILHDNVIILQHVQNFCIVYKFIGLC